MITRELAEGVVFGPLEPWRAAEFARAVDAAREHLLPWITFAARVVDEPSARELLQRYADLHAQDKGAIYGIWVDGVLRGGTIFVTFDVAKGVAELGVWLHPSVQGRGLIQAACRHMLDYAFLVRGLQRVEWYCDPTNVRSRAAAARLGMSYEGRLRSSYVVGGRRVDSEVWSVLAGEWPPAVESR